MRRGRPGHLPRQRLPRGSSRTYLSPYRVFRDHLDYARWMLKKDFADATKEVVRDIYETEKKQVREADYP